MIKNLSKKYVLVLIAAFSFFTLSIFNVKSVNSASLNGYIYKHNIKPAKITEDIWSKFPKYKYSGGKPKGVVIHETANPHSSIYSEIAYMKKYWRNAFVHSFVDDNRIINIANTNYLSWGVGYPGNARFIQFEQIEVHSKKAFAKEVNNSAYYTAYLLHKYNLPAVSAENTGKGTVWSHKSVAKHLGGSNHTDPIGYYKSNGKKFFGKAYTMSEFFSLVKHYYNKHSNKTTTNNSNGNNSSSNSSNSDVNQGNSNPVEDKAISSNSSNVVNGVTYNDGSGKDVAKLSYNYSKYGIYNHVKNAGYKTTSYKWKKLGVKAEQLVYVNNRAVHNKNHSVWYRIKFANNSNAKTYWVPEKALTFNSVQYSNSSESMTFNGIESKLYDNIPNSSHLSNEKMSNYSLLGHAVNTVQKATVKDINGNQSTWYKVSIDGHNYWANANSFSNN
ncbi:peptidoglycan recognition protein family protein [Apilactobacillus ozensis]|uniref:peptidoglycan recognition protein family protein n=1 Tax=Apilactobacillus ozensis TaxID=866801 RepID=UPI00200B160C|nr:peptidoglycan recognition family protein [Apilactobacillus ozensis]MCK8607741.1 peptidoglycan recognition protein family protein [Apilactobacillus ozensis]